MDENGNPVRYPIRLSEFQERQKFYISTKAEKDNQIPTQMIDNFQLAQWAGDVNRFWEKNRGGRNESHSKYNVKYKKKGRSL